MPAAVLAGEASRELPAAPSGASRLRALLPGRSAALSGVRCGCLAAVSRSASSGAAAAAAAAPPPCSTCSTRAGRYSFSPWFRLWVVSHSRATMSQTCGEGRGGGGGVRGAAGERCACCRWGGRGGATAAALAVHRLLGILARQLIVPPHRAGPPTCRRSVAPLSCGSWCSPSFKSCSSSSSYPPKYRGTPDHAAPSSGAASAPAGGSCERHTVRLQRRRASAMVGPAAVSWRSSCHEACKKGRRRGLRCAHLHRMRGLEVMSRFAGCTSPAPPRPSPTHLWQRKHGCAGVRVGAQVPRSGHEARGRQRGGGACGAGQGSEPADLSGSSGQACRRYRSKAAARWEQCHTSSPSPMDNTLPHRTHPGRAAPRWKLPA